MRLTLSESLKIERATDAEIKYLLERMGVSADDLSPDEISQLELKARTRAESGFYHSVDQGIDERKERKAFGEDR